MTTATSVMETDNFETWDDDADVVVIGFGGAGAVAAITAHDSGAKVLILEKMPDPGGLTVISAGGVRMTNDRDGALAYLEASSGGRTPRAHLEVLAAGMMDVPDWLRGWALAAGATVELETAPGNYPLPGFDRLGFASIGEVVPALASMRTIHAASQLTGGGRLFHVLERNVHDRGIRVHLGHAAKRLIRLQDGAIGGVLVRSGSGLMRVRAKRAVILACGGFEANEAMKQNYFQAMPVFAGSFAGNTGDGIAMAQEAGADLWHMWHYHGPYGLRHTDPAYPYAFYMKALPMWTPDPSGAPQNAADGAISNVHALPPMAWILVDQTGRRFMDEYPPYPGDTGIRPLDAFDPHTQSFPRIPAHAIFDDAGRQLYPIGRSIANGRHPVHDWSSDNIREVELGILQRAETIGDLAEQIGVSPDVLADTLTRWNESCRRRHDDAFGRRPETMIAMETPPFYHAKVWPLVLNTQGGPVHDPRQRVLNPFGEPIERLFAAGELGSVFGHLYLAGGNLAECIIGGRIAGREAAALSPWQSGDS